PTASAPLHDDGCARCGRFVLHLLQVDLQIARVLIPAVGVLAQAPLAYPLQLARQSLYDLPSRFGLVAQNRRQDREHAVAAESASAREHLVEYGAKAEDVGTGIYFV